MDDFDWIDTSSEGRLHSAIYKCTECSKKVAYGDNFCRHCGIKFTPAMCAQKRVTYDYFSAFLTIALTR